MSLPEGRDIFIFRRIYMIQVNITNIVKQWGNVDLFSGLNFSISYGERVGLVGANGSGKSTLLSIMSGSIQADNGNIFTSVNTSIAYLRQSPLSDQELCTMYPEEWSDEVKLYMRLLRLNIAVDSDLSSLSEGERTKLAVSLLLAQRPTLLLLDEPTNNMDSDGARMLATLLQEYSGTILIVSHDRYFLDCTVTRILEIEQGRVVEYNGNYSSYRDQKSRLFVERLHRYEDDRKEQQRIEDAVKQLKQWSDKAHRKSRDADPSGQKMGLKEFKRAKAKKMDQKVKSDLLRLERLTTSGEKRPTAEPTIRFAISAQVAHGKRILQASGISKSYGTYTLFSESSFSIARGDRVALFGPNGCGKSTLIHMITGLTTPDTGELWISPSCKPYVLSQTFSGFTENITVQQYLLDTIGHLSGHDRALLSHLGITKRHLEQKLPTISFGEQMKIKLAEPILAQRDFIILDEPTNHIDLPMREMLENTLAEYSGTLLLVSHDLYFLSKICSKVLVWEDGVIRGLDDSFEEYLEKRHVPVGLMP
jgi:macrolide transport system ATP-binding/permease protein